MREGHFDLVVIGSGPAGQRAAVQAAKLGKSVAVVERRRGVGGVCARTGTIPSKTFREAVRMFADAPQWAVGMGARPAMEQLVSRVGSVVEREVAIVRDQLARNRVELLRGEARFEGPHEIRVEGPDGNCLLHADHVLVAVGTNPSNPPGVTPDGRRLAVPDDVLALDKLPRSMAVVGGGVIGVEYACAFAALGVHVTLVDRRERILEFLDREMSDELVHQMRRANITFRMGEAVADVQVVEDLGGAGVLRLESGKIIVADVILFSVGRVGATAELDLSKAGIEADSRGRISVDEDFRTSQPHVYAAGDVIGFPALAATSAEQGRLAACHMFGEPAQPLGVHFPVGIYSIPEMSMVGPTEEELTAKGIPYETGVARYREIARGQILGDDSGLFKMIFHRDTHRLLAIHCIGSGATELVHVGQAVIAFEGGLDYFVNTVMNYPTLAECYKVAAYNTANKLRHAQVLCGALA